MLVVSTVHDDDDFIFVLKSTLLLKMHELCKTPIPTFDPLTPTLSPPPPPLAAAYKSVIFDKNCPLPPFLPSFAISKDDETRLVINKRVFRPIPRRNEQLSNSCIRQTSTVSTHYVETQLRPRIQHYNE